MSGRRLGLALDEAGLEHDAGAFHPESPGRLARLVELWASPAVRALEPVTVPLRSAAREELERIHSPEYLTRLEAARGTTWWIDADTCAGPRSYDAAVGAAGAALAATEAVVRGDVDGAFVAVRPPGHHAVRRRGMGFCLLNNVALAAALARAALGVRRVAVIDFDVHHGNGTQEAFYADPDLLYLSTHQSPFYPGTGALGETGAGDGLGLTLNVPLRPGHGDEHYEAIYGGLVARVLRDFAPALLLVSAGLDVHAADPIGGMRVHTGAIATLAAQLVAAAEEAGHGRVVFVLEGGYALDALAEGVLACLQALAGRRRATPLAGPLDTLPLGDGRRALAVAAETFSLS